VHLSDRMGIVTGVQLDGFLEASPGLGGVPGRPVPGQVARSGPSCEPVAPS